MPSLHRSLKSYSPKTKAFQDSCGLFLAGELEALVADLPRATFLLCHPHEALVFVGQHNGWQALGLLFILWAGLALNFDLDLKGELAYAQAAPSKEVQALADLPDDPCLSETSFFPQLTGQSVQHRGIVAVHRSAGRLP